MQALAALPGLSGVVCSRWFSSAPGAAIRPAALHQRRAGALRSRLDGPSLLAALHPAGAGSAAGSAGLPNAARTLDLDLIDLDGAVTRGPGLVLPHPRAHLRGFVLYPLRDVAPHWCHPVSGAGVGALIAALPQEDTRPV